MTLADVLAPADHGLFDAKAAGRDRVVGDGSPFDWPATAPHA